MLTEFQFNQIRKKEVNTEKWGIFTRINTWGRK